MKMRLHGTLDEIEESLRRIKQTFNVVSVSKSLSKEIKNG